jgi:hypothetical protein
MYLVVVYVHIETSTIAIGDGIFEAFIGWAELIAFRVHKALAIWIPFTITGVYEWLDGLKRHEEHTHSESGSRFV